MSRLIDADVLIEKIDIGKDCAECQYNEEPFCRWKPDVIDVCEAICTAPTIKPEQRWIPCSERLPEEKINLNTQDYDWVLCSTTFGDVRAYNFGRGRFLHGCGDVTQYVIAWMPLPEPYQEGADE